MLQGAQIQIEEAERDLSQFIDSFEMDPQRLQEIENRLSLCYDIARKHRVAPDELTELHQSLTKELQQLDGGETHLADLEAEVEQLWASFLAHARKLAKSRTEAARKLQKAVNEQLQLLAMKNARFEVAIHNDEEKPSHSGFDQVEFLVSTNPGQQPKSLGKVASGGELSRISLAIQVVTAQHSVTPTLVFDEVDVGIGGATADIVGRMLRQLGDQGQILCVTHLPQVATKGHQHLLVHKTSGESAAETTLTELEGEDKILEVARMMGGEELTKQTIAHAKEMLTLVD